MFEKILSRMNNFFASIHINTDMERLRMKSDDQCYGLNFTALNQNGVAESIKNGTLLFSAYNDAIELNSAIFVTTQQGEQTYYCFPAGTLEEYEHVYRVFGSVEE